MVIEPPAHANPYSEPPELWTDDFDEVVLKLGQNLETINGVHPEDLLNRIHEAALSVPDTVIHSPVKPHEMPLSGTAIRQTVEAGDIFSSNPDQVMDCIRDSGVEDDVEEVRVSLPLGKSANEFLDELEPKIEPYVDNVAGFRELSLRHGRGEWFDEAADYNVDLSEFEDGKPEMWTEDEADDFAYYVLDGDYEVRDKTRVRVEVTQNAGYSKEFGL